MVLECAVCECCDVGGVMAPVMAVAGTTKLLISTCKQRHEGLLAVLDRLPCTHSLAEEALRLTHQDRDLTLCRSVLCRIVYTVAETFLPQSD